MLARAPFTRSGALVLLSWFAAGRAPAGEGSGAPVAAPEGYRLVWSDEFDTDGAPDPSKWTYELGFIRNNEHQLYRRENAWCEGGMLIIEARRERKPNPYHGLKGGWQYDRPHADYTSAMLTTWGRARWLYGRFEMRGRIDTRRGMWPAWWTLGSNIHFVGHPSCGEIDIMEYYGAKGLMSNVCWGPWNTGKRPVSSEWAREFHVWRMDWDEQRLEFRVDDRPWNSQDLSKTVTRHGNPFHEPQYMLLNLAIGGDWGGDPSGTDFPARLEVDYVRVFQKPSQAPERAPSPGPAARPKRAPPRRAAGQAGLVGHWRFDERSGAVVLDSAGANVGEVVNPSGAARVAGRTGGALELKGSSYVKVPDADALDVEREITVAAWIRLADPGGEQCVAAKGTNFVFCEFKGAGRPYNVLNVGGGPTAHWASFPYSKETPFLLGKWHHVAFTYDGAKVVNYIDGSPDGEARALTGPLAAGWDWLGIGTNGAWADKHFRGAIDDFRVYSRALAAAEIAGLAAGARSR